MADKSLFKPRKHRSQKKRKRERTSTLAGDVGDEADGSEVKSNVTSHEELLMLKEAQNLRERSRQTGLSASLLMTTSAEADGGGVTKREDMADGLRSHFSVEKAGAAVDERMARFIEEGMRKKFGDRYVQRQSHGGGNAKATVSVNENGRNSNGIEEEIFEIPEHLKVEPRRLYDPSDGMPNAGLEETEVNVKDQEEKEKEHRNVVKRKHELSNNKNTKESIEMSGNFSSNFAFHTRWKNNTTHSGDKNSKTHRQPSRHADAKFADRFRKRWKQQ